VLRIRQGSRTVLVAGDIDKVAERRLLKLGGIRLAADALVVPHHGSTTSSTPEFVHAVAPRWALFAVGWRNRFGHPRDAVLQRYREAGSAILRSDESGAVTLRFRADGVDLERHRMRDRRYWRDA